MEETATASRLTSFLGSGVYQLEHPNVVFLDPVRVLNRSYSRFRVSPSSYYPRFFESKQPVTTDPEETKTALHPKKRKRKEKTKIRAPNQRELAADNRHQQVRPLLLRARELLTRETTLLVVMKDLRRDSVCGPRPGETASFVELGRVWQAPLCEIALNFGPSREEPNVDGRGRRVLPLFNNIVANESDEDVEAEFLGCKYVMPRDSCFYMSDLSQIHGIIPVESHCGFNLITIDPPWENASARQKVMLLHVFNKQASPDLAHGLACAKICKDMIKGLSFEYPTLPNRYFLSLPIRQLSHADGALVALWVTNREKLRNFVEEELFPAWGVSYAASFYWLKVKSDGSLISDLDLFHHRPYECLLLGYCYGKGMISKPVSGLAAIQDKIILSIPGDYSRKPPIGELLLEHVPGFRPPRCVELFAREMMSGWTSWGNEPLHFQELNYFIKNELDYRSK